MKAEYFHYIIKVPENEKKSRRKMTVSPGLTVQNETTTEPGVELSVI